EVTPWAGMVLMKQMLEKLDFSNVLGQAGLPVQGSNRGYSPVQLITNFLLGVWCGANCFEHLDVTKQDKVISQVFDWQRMPGHRAFKRYFQKFGQGTNQQVFTYLYQWFFSNLQFDNYTLDFDSSVLTRYGSQQGASKGYNPQKPGRASHHPIMAFVHECRMVANCWLRPGNSYTTNNFLSFLEDTLENLKGKTVSLIRADSGFYSKEVLDYLETRPEGVINYVIACRFILPIKQKLAAQKTWLTLDDGIQIAETTYQAHDWQYPRRLVMVRQQISIRPKAAGKQLRLFEDEGIYKNYRYSCFITNMHLSAKIIYDLYRNRADAENRIKEVKYDFGFDSFNCKDFWATEATLNFVMLAYNLMSLFRQAVLGAKVQNQMKTLRYRVFAIGGYMIKKGNSRILKLSLQMKRREWFTGLWSSAAKMSWPFVLSK
ncbi:MAG TPA: IS1380 family transposase, partial [Bacteroidales bacterium]|nr:IS1380 family transposase [Bacteroidales bacterium]